MGTLKEKIRKALDELNEQDPYAFPYGADEVEFVCLKVVEGLQEENKQLKQQVENARNKLFNILTEYEIGNYDSKFHNFYKDVYDVHNELMELAE